MKHVYYHMQHRWPAQVRCMEQSTQSHCTGTTQGDGMGRVVGEVLWWRTHVHPWLIHVNVRQKPPQYCKVISLQLIWKVEVKSLSHVRLFVTTWTVAYQATPSMGFSSQEYWSGLPFLLQGIFPTQRSNLGFLHCRQTLYRLSHQGILHNFFLLATILFQWIVFPICSNCTSK